MRHSQFLSIQLRLFSCLCYSLHIMSYKFILCHTFISRYVLTKTKISFLASIINHFSLLNLFWLRIILFLSCCYVINFFIAKRKVNLSRSIMLWLWWIFICIDCSGLWVSIKIKISVIQRWKKYWIVCHIIWCFKKFLIVSSYFEIAFASHFHLLLDLIIIFSKI